MASNFNFVQSLGNFLKKNQIDINRLDDPKYANACLLYFVNKIAFNTSNQNDVTRIKNQDNDINALFGSSVEQKDS